MSGPVTRRLLVLLRHAKSDWSGGEPDLLRPLAPRGRRQAPEAGRWLAGNLSRIDLALVSPATRARQTWDLASAELGTAPPVRVEEDLYAASVVDLLSVVDSRDAGVSVVVAHNPGLEELVARLSGQQLVLPTSAIAAVDLDAGVLLAHGRPPPALPPPGRVS